ncbi:MAG: hypothetical protein CMI30_12185 [Opitutae bacterium]|nr:hypothetical protein [Opitutae bacterium]|tara:strand:- start:2533 stop:4269 length:1737 start_codon:yes stop_codon:yes gene_type:complete
MKWLFKIRLILESIRDKLCRARESVHAFCRQSYFKFRLLIEKAFRGVGLHWIALIWAQIRKLIKKICYGWFLVFWGMRKRWNGRGAWIVFSSLVLFVCGLVAVGLYAFKEGRYSLAVWRAEQAVGLLDSNQTEEAHRKALTAFLSYPDDLEFLRLAVKTGRAASAKDYRLLAEQLAIRPDATVEDVLPLVDGFLEIAQTEEAERWLKVAIEKGLQPKEAAKRLLQLDLLAGQAGRFPALLRASAMIKEGIEDPEVALAYASLCLLWKVPEQRRLALDKLKGWTEDEGVLGLVALQALSFFPELDEKERALYRKRFEERMESRPADDQFAARMRFLRKSREVPQGKEDEWFNQLHTMPFTVNEKLALEGGVLWRAGKVEQGRQRFLASLEASSQDEFPLLEGEILSTGDLDLTILLLLRYRESPHLQKGCDALLIDLYRRANRKKSAEYTAKNFSLASLRSKPNLLAATARAKILVSEDHLGEAVVELERLVAKYPFDPDFRELLGLVYYLQDKYRFALELVPEAPNEFPLKRRARIKGLRYACLQKTEEKSSLKADFPDEKELEALDPRERELLGIKL